MTYWPESVAEECIRLRSSHPHAPAIDVLDLVVRAAHAPDRTLNTVDDPAVAAWLQPGNSFGCLLREAFPVNSGNARDSLARFMSFYGIEPEYDDSWIRLCDG
jgi:hypothetical protein